MDNSILLTLGLGFALGLKHATEADHLAAVTAIVSERRSIWESAKVGVLWGLGHTTSLLIAGSLVVVMGVVVPERVSRLLELCVAVMIILLGTRLLYIAKKNRQRAHIHAHTHDGRHHFHLHFHENRDAHPIVQTHEGPHGGLSRLRTFLVGVMHGLAGSAALTLLVLTAVMRNGSAVLGLSYLLVFGVGSIGGMLIMSCLIGLPFLLSFRLSNRLPQLLQLSAAAASVAFGFFYAWRIIS
jgi:ABC-type nickel/cobalt efflux system permease component RcnA